MTFVYEAKVFHNQQGPVRKGTISTTLRSEPEDTGWIQFQKLFQNQSGNFSEVQFGDLSLLLGKFTPFTFMIITDMYDLNSVTSLFYLKFPLFSIFSYILYILSLSCLLLFSLPGNLERNKYKVLFLFFWSTAYLNMHKFVSISNYHKYKSSDSKERTVREMKKKRKFQLFLNMRVAACPSGISIIYRVIANKTWCMDHLICKGEAKEEL